MKTIKIGIVTLIMALGVTSCSQDKVIIDEADIIRISSIIDNSYIDATTPQSRVEIGSDGTGNFNNGDKWGMYAAVSAIDTVLFEKTNLNNSLYIVGETVLKWKDLSTSTPVTFSAYYPYVASIPNPTAYMFNVATASNPDLLLAPPVTKKNGEDVTLSFKHAMHRLKVSLTRGAGVTGDISNATISLLNMKTTAKVNLLTGKVGVTGATTESGNYSPKTGAGTWLVAPQELASGSNWIEVNYEGRNYIYKVPPTLTKLESGKQVELIITLKQ